jgi:hypothetical protein
MYQFPFYKLGVTSPRHSELTTLTVSVCSCFQVYVPVYGSAKIKVLIQRTKFFLANKYKILKFQVELL